jgi:hypothetical protein
MVKNENKNLLLIHPPHRQHYYKVKVVFNEGGTETMEDKILRIIAMKSTQMRKL